MNEFKNKSLRIVFFGSDDFAAVNLNAILTSSHAIVGVVTGPDKPQGRGMKMSVSPIKEIALEKGISYLQPASLKEASVVAALKDMHADLFVVVAYGRLLNQAILDIPKIFSINVHGSLLPQYRGAAPVNWAVLNGDTFTGVTVQQVALALDAGDILSQERMDIGPDENAAQLRSRMAGVGASLLVKTINDISQGKTKSIPQGDQFTYAPKLTKEMGKIDWHKSAQEIHRQIRGLQPWPGAFTLLNGKTLKIHLAQVVSMPHDKKPGEVVGINKQGFIVACGTGSLLVLSVQPEAGKVMPASSFCAGHAFTFLG